MAAPAKVAKAAHQSAGFTEVAERGRGWLRSRKPGTEQYAVTTQVGGRGWHFGDGPYTEAEEVDTAWVDALPGDAPWQKRMILADYNAYLGNDAAINFDSGQIMRYVHPATGAEIAFQPQQLQWTNDLDQISGIEIPLQVAATVTDDTALWVDGYGPGLDFQVQTQTARLQKLLTIDTLSAIGSPPPFIVSGGNPVLRLQFILQKSSGVEIWIDGALWNEKSNNPRTTSSAVEFRSGGQVLWYFQPAWATDAEGEQITPVYRFRNQANNLFVEVRTPWTWLETAIYPVRIDPTVDEQVGAGADDGHERQDQAQFKPSDNDLLWQSNTAGNAQRWDAFTRFTTIGVSQGDTIDTAYWEGYTVYNRIYPYGYIRAEDVDATVNLTTSGTIITRTRTTAGVLVDTTVTNNAWHLSSYEIKTVIQEVVDRAGWSDNGDIAIILENLDRANSKYLGVYSYEGSTSLAPKLHIEYTAGGGGGVSGRLGLHAITQGQASLQQSLHPIEAGNV